MLTLARSLIMPREGCRGARTGAGTEEDGIVEAEQIFADVHRGNSAAPW